MPVNPRFGPARGIWRRLMGLGCLLRWRGGFRILARCACPVILSARMPGAEKNIARTALGEEHGDGCWTRVRFPPSPPFAGVSWLVARITACTDARPARFAFAHHLASSRGDYLLLTSRCFAVDLQCRLWYHLFCEARKARARDSLEGTREWLSARTRLLT